MNFLGFLFGDTVASLLLSALLIVFGGFIVGKLARLILVALKTRVAKRTKSSLDDFILTVVANFIVLLVTIVTLYWVTKGLMYHFANATVFIKNLIAGVNTVVYVAMILYAVFMISRIIDSMVLWYLKDVASKTQTKLDDELAPLVNRLLNILIYAIGVIIIMHHFQQDISTLVVSLGVGSLAIALAAQETLANMIAGFVLMIDRPFRLDDRIRLPDGTIGNVKQIGIRSTKVIDDNQVMIITPNAEIVKSQIKNFSYPNDVVRFQVPFGVAYGTDLERMRTILVERVNHAPDIIDPHTTEIRITELGDSSVNAELFCYIQNPNVIPRRKSDLTLLIYNTLAEHNIEIPFPQRVVHLSPGGAKLKGESA